MMTYLPDDAPRSSDDAVEVNVWRRADGKVVMSFDRATGWLALTPEQARLLAAHLEASASDA